MSLLRKKHNVNKKHFQTGNYRLSLLTIRIRFNERFNVTRATQWAIADGTGIIPKDSPGTIPKFL